MLLQPWHVKPGSVAMELVLSVFYGRNLQADFWAGIFFNPTVGHCVFKASVCIQQMSWFCFHLLEVLGTLEPLKLNDPGGLPGIKDLSFTCWSVTLLKAFHKQILTGMWQEKKGKILLLTFPWTPFSSAITCQWAHPSLLIFFNEHHFQLFYPQCCSLTFFS